MLLTNCNSDDTFLSSAERPPGYDRVRNAEIGNKDFELDVLEEAYTTEHWLVRIYKVKLSLLFETFTLGKFRRSRRHDRLWLVFSFICDPL